MFFEAMRFWSEVLKPLPVPCWNLPSTVTFEDDSLKLRCFTHAPGEKTPILILAPNAGHHQNICEPLVKRCIAVDAARPVYVIEWIPPTPQCSHRFDSIGDIVQDVAGCVRRLGNRVHLFGLCQGGWVAALYAALYPGTVASYVNAAGPIDFTAGDAKIHSACKKLPMSYYENMVAMSGGVQRGESQLFSFKSLNAYDRYVGDYADLWLAICEGDEGKVKKWRRFKEWYDQPVNLPGTWYIEAVDKLFKKNLLIKGELDILGRKVELKQISCPVFLIAGDRDDITPPDQVFNMARYVSGPARKKLIEDAGHIAVFVKESSLRHWETAILKNLDAIDSGAPILSDQVTAA